MKNFTKLLIFIINLLSIASVHSKNNMPPCDPPIVTNPIIYYCQNSVASAIALTPSAGGTLNWYGTNATGGTASPSAPVPTTTTVGSTTYYVSQTIGGCESVRVQITVKVVANSGLKLNLFCDGSLSTSSSIYFDFANVGQTVFNYSYSVAGGPLVTGVWVAPSHYIVSGLSPGQSVTFTISAEGAPCVPTESITCNSTCTSNSTPNFAAIPAFCYGTTAPILTNTSPNGVVGTWLPATVSNTTSGNYVFTPNPILNPCAFTQTLSVTVIPNATPTFTSIPTALCQNAIPPILPSNSNNTPSISGTWSPSSINTSALGTITYSFTPSSGQCVTASSFNYSITINPVLAPDFANIAPFCSGTPAPVLANTSPNGISGTWYPTLINNAINGTYTFTPNTSQCATTQMLSVSIIPRIIPDFPIIPSFCTGTIAPLLANTSPNGITGTWSPSTINNTANGSYLFTPSTGQCASNQTLNVFIDQLVLPNFDDVTFCLGTPAPILNKVSPNGITGSWSPPTIDNTINGSYLFTPNLNQCASSQSITATINKDTLVNVDWNVSAAFNVNQIITIIASNAGNYLYQLDGGSLQSNSVFENVTSGNHNITVYDANGCSSPITINNVLVIDYPKNFTPNGDSYNDTWNISDLKNQYDAKIFIFDRYAKLIKQIKPRGEGWDGTLNGNPLPSTDYWFTVEYNEQGVSKIFKSHFSLMR